MSNETLYYGALRTCLQMMQDRHYQIPNYWINLTLPEFEIMFKSNNINLISDVIETTPNGSPRPVCVKIIYPDKSFHLADDWTNVSLEIVKQLILSKNALTQTLGQTLSQLKTTASQLGGLTSLLRYGKLRLIILYRARLPNTSCATTQQMSLEMKYINDPYIEIHQVHDLYINPTHNKYQPIWRLITDQNEIKQIYQQYDATASMFGSVCIDDPINRYYRGRPLDFEGKRKYPDLYEIIRGGNTIFYRKVVNKLMNLKHTKKTTS